MSEIEGRLPRARLLLLCQSEAVLKWMNTCDHLMYQALVEILIPDVLRPIPSKWNTSLLKNLITAWYSESYFPVTVALTRQPDLTVYAIHTYTICFPP